MAANNDYDNNNREQPRVKVNLDPEVTQQYTIEYLVGRGAFSVVYLGVNKVTKEPRAIKVINKASIGMDQKTEKRMDTEITILKTVSHPNIIPLYEVIDTKNYIYLIMEYVSGGELFDKIVDKGCYTEKEARQVVAKVLSAISYLHNQKIVHRDLKPENLLVKANDDTHVMISDFGLSSILTDKSWMSTACGTPYYVAPEIVTATGKYGEKVDIWSLGVVTYFLLAGFPPFMGDNLQQIVEQIMEAKFDFPDPYWTDISGTEPLYMSTDAFKAEAKDFVSKLLVTDPDQRLSAEAALNHAWLASTKVSSKPLQITEMMKNTKAKIKNVVQSYRQNSV